MRRFLQACFVAAFSVLSLGGFARAEPLKIAYSDWPGWIAWEVAVQKGFFKEAGVDVEMVWMEYLPSLEAFAAGKVDAVTCTNGDAMVTGATGKPGTAILLTDYSNGNDKIVGRPGINSIKDLKGKKVGLELNLVEHLLLLKALEVNGMTEADVELVNVATNETPQALAGGMDAIGAWYPIAGQAEKQMPGAKSLFTSADAKGLIFDGTFVSRESLQARREDWQKVVGVWIKTVEFIQAPATRDEAIKIMASRAQVSPEEYGPNLAGTFLLGLEGNLKAFEKSGSLESVYGSSKIADAFNVKYGVYKEAQDIDSYLDPSFMKAAAAMKK
ncbi:MAG TPA: ABC transporter substrate-binding protein [Tepidisphaeraceae bacterium]